MRIKIINLLSSTFATTVKSWTLPVPLPTKTIPCFFLTNLILAVFATVGWAVQDNGNDNSQNRIAFPWDGSGSVGINPLIVSVWSGRPTGLEVKIKDMTTGQILQDWTGLGNPKLEFRTKDVLGYDLPVGHIIRVRTRPRTTSQTWPVSRVDFEVKYVSIRNPSHTIGTEIRSFTSTFLRTNGDNLGPMLIAPDDQYAPSVMGFRLSAYGMFPGDFIKITSDLPYSTNDAGTTHGTNLVAVFSSTSEILTDPSEQHRVPGAIDAGTDVVTPPTHFGGLPTDIPEDFLATREGVVVRVPDNADYIFVSHLDSFFSDNGLGHVTIRPATTDEINRAFEPEFLIGDVNRDGSVNFQDISGFVSILSTGDFQAEADINGDDSVSFLDIAPFIALLSN